MEVKPMLASVITAVATAAVMTGIAYFGGLFQKGIAAGEVEQIRAVIKDELTTDAGKTYGQVVTEMSLGINTLNTKVDALTVDVNDLEQNLFDLTSD